MLRTFYKDFYEIWIMVQYVKDLNSIIYTKPRLYTLSLYYLEKSIKPTFFIELDKPTTGKYSDKICVILWIVGQKLPINTHLSSYLKH